MAIDNMTSSSGNGLMSPTGVRPLGSPSAVLRRKRAEATRRSATKKKEALLSSPGSITVGALISPGALKHRKSLTSTMSSMNKSMSSFPAIDIDDLVGGATDSWGDAELGTSGDNNNKLQQPTPTTSNKKNLNSSWNNIDYLDEALLLASPVAPSPTPQTPTTSSARSKKRGGIKSKSKSTPISSKTRNSSSITRSSNSRPSTSLLPDCLPIEREDGDEQATEVVGLLGEMNLAGVGEEMALSSMHSTNTASTTDTTGSDSTNNTPRRSGSSRYHRSSRTTRRSKSKSVSSSCSSGLSSSSSHKSLSRSTSRSSTNRLGSSSGVSTSTGIQRNATFCARLDGVEDINRASNKQNASFDNTTIKKPISSAALGLSLSGGTIKKKSIRGNSDLYRKSRSGNNLRSLAAL